MPDTLPSFSLDDQHRRTLSFPGGRPALLCFVKEDCPTCGLTMPLIEAAAQAFRGKVDVVAIGQDATGNALLVERHKFTAPMLDDSDLRISYAYNVEIVPTIILADGRGAELRRFEGFDKSDWQRALADIAHLAGGSEAQIDWSTFPKSRPGCGSKSVEPGVAERLAAAASGSRLRARQIELGADEDPFEFMFERGLTDGLPVVPPTPERVMRMLTGTRRDPQEVIATVPPNLAPLTIEKVAANAVMAGCRPEYLPVVIAVLEGVCTDEFNIHGVMATTAGATPIVVVNGPIRHRLGMNMKVGALGSGNRANATIGRAVKLALRNVGGARPGEIERTALGGPGKYTACYPEWEERSPWEPLHVERGFRAEDSVVTVFGLEPGPRLIVDQLSRTAHALAGSLGMALESCWHPKLHGYGEVLLVISPEHADTIKRDGWSKAQVRNRIQEASARPIRELLPDANAGEGMALRNFGLSNPTPEQLEQRIPKFRKPENINIIVTGGEAGKFSSAFGGWFSGPMGSISVSRKIEEVP
ncbi:MAG: TlpA family protein disulfide reductase [Candidatus Binataceae bacterium]